MAQHGQISEDATLSVEVESLAESLLVLSNLWQTVLSLFILVFLLLGVVIGFFSYGRYFGCY